MIPLRGPVITPRPFVVRAAAGSSYLLSTSTTWPRCFSGVSAPVRITFNPVTRARWRGYGTALTRPGFSRLRHYRGCCFRSKSLVIPDAGRSSLSCSLASAQFSGYRTSAAASSLWGARSPSSLALRLQATQPPLRELPWGGVPCRRLALAASGRSSEARDRRVAGRPPQGQQGAPERTHGTAARSFVATAGLVSRVED